MYVVVDILLSIDYDARIPRLYGAGVMVHSGRWRLRREGAAGSGQQVVLAAAATAAAAERLVVRVQQLGVVGVLFGIVLCSDAPSWAHPSNGRR